MFSQQAKPNMYALYIEEGEEKEQEVGGRGEIPNTDIATMFNSKF